jgi:hypothetical protein
MGESGPRESAGKERVPLGFGNLYASRGDHIGHFYLTNEEGKDVLVSFLETGLKAGDKCVALARGGREHQEVQDALAARGIDVDRSLASGQLVLDVGKPRAQELREMLGEALAEVPERYPLLRWVGVMSWALDQMPTSEALMEWESHCNTVETPAVIFLCQYELARFPGTVVMDAMKTHPISIVGNVVHQNPYYEDPGIYLEELRRRDSTALT